jgi:type IV secretory pathway VirD2 relaxase
MAKRIDGVLKEWGDRFDKPIAKGRKGRNISGGEARSRPKKTPTLKARDKLVLTVSKASEVMVKISGSGKDVKHIKAHLDYISRNGKLELEDERGNVYSGTAEVNELRDLWSNSGYRIKPENGTKRETFNIVLSMPPGTDRDAVKNAARDFAAETFSEHQYAFAAHEDEKHPHVHLSVKAVSLRGIRLNPRKADLQQWREQFADDLRSHGVQANATDRSLRGVTKKGLNQSVIHIDRGFINGLRESLSNVTKSQQLDKGNPEREYSVKGQPVVNLSERIKAKVSKTRSKVIGGYRDVATALATGDKDDKKLALNIVSFVKSMDRVGKEKAIDKPVREQSTVEQNTNSENKER